MNDYYLKRLSEEEAKAYHNIVRGLRVGSEQIRVASLNDKDVLMRVIRAVKYDLPEFFNVDFSLISHSTYTDGMEYSPLYIYGYGEWGEKKNRIRKRLDEILTELKHANADSIYEKCLWLHNYFVRNCVYNYAATEKDSGNKTAYTIEGFFLEKTAVCQGIALAYKFICTQLGIDVVVAYGNSLEPGRKEYGMHAWNIVMSNDAAIQMDVTWDMCLTQDDGPIRYDYFFLPDIEMMRDHQYVGYPICRNRDINMFSYKKAYFTAIESTKEYIDRVIEKSADGKRLIFQFKMKNRKETKEEVAKYISDYILEKTNKGFSYTYLTNEMQSVFLFDVKFK